MSLPNPLVSGVQQKVMHTETILHLLAAGLFKYVQPFSEFRY